MSKAYDWLLFDLDNTLLDFSASEKEALAKASLEVGLELTDSHYQLYRTINKECWTDYEHGKISKASLRSLRFSRFLAACRIYQADGHEFGASYLQYLSRSAHFIAGAQSLLEDLKPSYRLALITNGLTEVQRPRLSYSRLNDYFEVIVVSDEIGPAKPAAAFFDYAFREMGHPDPRRSLVIGDNLNADINGGLQYGTHAAWYNPGKEKRHMEVNPTYELGSLEELRTILQ